MTISHPPVPGSALWVHAHPRPDSLNGQLFTEGVRALGEQYRVATSDLYSQDFDPRLSHRDLGGSSLSGSDGSGSGLSGSDGSGSGRSGSTVELNAEAFSAGSLPSDVTAEQEKLAAAELLVIQFPLWWYGPPAILKGWLDRVLTAGFAVGDLDPHLGVPRRYGDGGLSGRRALVIVTAGEDERSIGHRGISGDVESLLFPLTHGALWYVGIDTFDLHVIHDADVLSPEQVQDEKDRLTGRLRALDSEQTRPYRRLSDGEYAGTRALKDTILPGRADLAIHRRDEAATA